LIARLDSLGPGSHAILVYESERERDEILSHYFEAEVGKRNYVYLLSATPSEEIGYLKKSKPLTAALNKSLVVEDAWGAFSRQPPHLYVTKKIRDIQELIDSGRFHEWSWAGDWAEMYYSRSGELLKTEQIIANMEHSGPIVCCFRTRGLSGLKITDLSKLVSFHNYVLFPRETFVGA
jgi:hypothetical protein